MDSVFTVDGVSELKVEQQRMKETESEMKQRNKQAYKQQEQMMKKMSLEKERQTKQEEQRLTRLLQIKIQRRFQAFPFLQEKIPPLSNKSSLAELQETDEMQKLELDLQGGEQRLYSRMLQIACLIQSMFGDGTGYVAQKLPPEFRLNLTGFSNVIASPQFKREVSPLITETVIEYPWLCQMGLATRWLEAIAGAMFTVHQMNTNPMIAKMKKNGPMTEEQMKEFLEKEVCCRKEKEKEKEEE